MYSEHDFIIYTDGSSYSGPRKGGLGARFVTIDQNGHERIHDFTQPGYKNATNNQMELYACILALKEAQKKYDLANFNNITIKSDSKYVTDNIYNAKFRWPSNKWKNKEGRPIDNADLWKKLIREIKRIRNSIEFKWVKGHSKDQHNKAVDKLAKQSAKNAINKPLHVVSVRRKTTTNSVDIGSVDMKGQRLLIRVITTEYLKVQKVYKYKYEVKSKSSKYHGNVDFIFSKLMIKDGHCYVVSLNKNTKNPTIIRVLSEVDCKTDEIIDVYAPIE